MNRLINEERFTSCADINFGPLNMTGMFNGFYSININDGALKTTHKINLCCCCWRRFHFLYFFYLKNYH